jgi:hypothetical protein
LRLIEEAIRQRKPLSLQEEEEEVQYEKIAARSDRTGSNYRDSEINTGVKQAFDRHVRLSEDLDRCYVSIH